MTAWSSAASIQRKRPRAASSSPILVPLDVKKGDKVLFGKWSGTEVKIDGHELLIMKESDIMGVIGK
jgi:chaperonin GroES